MSMVLLDGNGKPQANLKGGELVISREESRKLLDMASKSNSNKELMELGKFFISVREKQIKRDGY